ncbi:septum site-determining protein MinC [Cohnella algarum]|uniref:septum site-determining protein MinC n=1 Tax=Cohnella algarum TaxID=2044859 RepID=UPI0019674BEE|nr:septum site-determining protein MinC [Cohnella algarum]MBN2984848.1 septum site-determining protein MinC [Cohnella algarum]
MNGKSAITIKGVKEGLVFLLDDQCDFVSLLDELQAKLDKHEQQLAGPIVHVTVKLGSRKLGEEDKERIRSAIRRQGNFLVQSIESDAETEEAAAPGNEMHTIAAIVRSGQTIELVGDLLLIGDVNPGGTVRCTGDIYIMGALRGIAHAGYPDGTGAIIAASRMTPTQLRIADVISRPPEEWTSSEPWMEYAYLRDGVMEMDKLTHLHHHRKQVLHFKGV